MRPEALRRGGRAMELYLEVHFTDVKKSRVGVLVGVLGVGKVE